MCVCVSLFLTLLLFLVLESFVIVSIINRFFPCHSFSEVSGLPPSICPGCSVGLPFCDFLQLLWFGNSIYWVHSFLFSQYIFSFCWRIFSKTPEKVCSGGWLFAMSFIATSCLLHCLGGISLSQLLRHCFVVCEFPEWLLKR